MLEVRIWEQLEAKQETKKQNLLPPSKVANDQVKNIPRKL